jgi:hypothetical protein
MFCEKPTRIETDLPSFLVGKWRACTLSMPEFDTTLTLQATGNYTYKISKQIDSVTSDNFYWEWGTWQVDYVDVDHDKRYSNTEENHLRTSVEASSSSENIGRIAYSMFIYTVSAGREFLEIKADTNITLMMLEKDTIGSSK